MTDFVSRSELHKVVAIKRGRLPEPRSRNEAQPPLVRIHLLGAMSATSYLGKDVLPRGRRARAILGMLCLDPGVRQPRGRLANMLWERVPDLQARASFRQAFREIMVALGDLGDDVILSDRETVQLNAGPCWIDARAVLAAETAPRPALRSDLVELCKGELLEGLDGLSNAFDQWLLGERTRFNEKLRILLETELKQAQGSNPDASQRAEIARRLIAFEPTHEGASRILMRALADMGERAQAMREYARCREALRQTVDVEPSAETYALYEAIRMFSGREEKEPAPPPVTVRKKPVKAQDAPAEERNRLRVGVLPFLSTRGPNDESLAFSLSQEIATGLARFRWFDVIPPMALRQRLPAAFVTDVPVQRNELDYVLDGAVSSSGESSHISVRLLDLRRYATPVWSDRFDLSSGDVHTFDEIITRIVGRIDPVILFIEGRRRETFGATGLLLHAIALIYSMEREKYEEAGRLLDRAVEMEPENAKVAAWAAHWHVFYVGQGWTQNVAQSFITAQEHALRAIKADPDNAEALGIYAHICAFFHKDFDSALHYFDRALRLNPNLAFNWAFSSGTYCYVGEPEEALRRLARYRELAPFDPFYFWFENFFTVAYMFKGDYAQAVTVGRRAVKANPEFSNGYKPLIAAMGQLGLIEEARPYVRKLLDELEPKFTVKRFAKIYPIKKDSDRERYMDGLRRAGIPEG
jgi:DNA-binding SARP family transcriptional activator/Tfp pilus assembly protein PilF